MSDVLRKLTWDLLRTLNDVTVRPDTWTHDLFMKTLLKAYEEGKKDGQTQAINAMDQVIEAHCSRLKERGFPNGSDRGNETERKKETM